MKEFILSDKIVERVKELSKITTADEFISVVDEYTTEVVDSVGYPGDVRIVSLSVIISACNNVFGDEVIIGDIIKMSTEFLMKTGSVREAYNRVYGEMVQWPLPHDEYYYAFEVVSEIFKRYIVNISENLDKCEIDKIMNFIFKVTMIG